METDSFLEVKKLEVVYFHVSTAIQGVSFVVSKGQIFGIIGSNGAGKTTTMRAISGFLGSDNAEITDGDILLEGQRLNGLQPHRITKFGIVLVPERKKTFDTLTVEENLAVSVSIGGEKKYMEQRIYNYFPSLANRRYNLAGYLSGGERQMLAISKALLCFPSLLLVDEASMGLAPIVTTQLFATLVQMRIDLGLTLVLVEQNATAALKIADYAAVMENGRIVYDGIPQKLLAHDDVREFYLGLRDTGEKSYRDVKQYRRTRRWY